MTALNMALDVIRRSRRKKFVIFSDSLSSLQAVKNLNIQSELSDILTVFHVLTSLSRCVGYQVMLVFLGMKKLILLQSLHFSCLLQK